MATSLVRSKPVFLLTALGEAEFTNAVELRVFRKEWTRPEARAVRDLFQQHQAAGVFRMVPLGSEIWERVLALSRGHSAKLGTRTLDLLHVASALILKPDVFYTFDKRQRTLAKTQRLRILPT
jgi:predicted nucleic acid-binding protein